MDPWFEKYIEGIDKRLESLENKVDQLLQFKWQIIGGSVLLSLILTLIINFIPIIWGK